MQDPVMQQLLENSYLSGNNADYLEALYEQFLKDPDSVAPQWANYFSSLPRVNGAGDADVSHADIRAEFLLHSKQQKSMQPQPTGLDAKQVSVDRLVHAYRRFGHYAARLDPLGSQRQPVPELNPGYFQLTDADKLSRFNAFELMGVAGSTLSDIETKLKKVYCSAIGSEYMHIRDENEVEWIRERLENHANEFSEAEKLKILGLLVNADVFEKYLGAKYVGQKRFSLEGGDTLIPMLAAIAEMSGRSHVKELVMGMAHRGRLNVLANIFGQSAEELFQEFEGRKDYGITTGDVKYHLGFSSDVNTENGPIHLSLAFNPSHLEIISPVVLGSVRARQHSYRDSAHDSVVPVIMHGDAAFSGQGVVMETFNMSQTRAQTVGGTIHIVINNQIGFTTSDIHDARSSYYCTDVAKMIDAPVFHVNGDDPEACVFIAKLAFDYRMRFHKDVVIELVCYRRHGHNEADEPKSTQPLMYQKIDQHPVPKDIYGERLIAEKVCDQAYLQKLVDQYRDAMDAGKSSVETISGGLSHIRQANWTPYLTEEWEKVVPTTFPKDRLIQLAKQLSSLPTNFHLQRQVATMMSAREKMAAGEQSLDWGFAENLAYATLLNEGFDVRLFGQDARRGTFAHRHAVLHDQVTGEVYCPLQQLVTDKTDFQVYDSLLSELAAMAFEYGYAKSDPRCLVLWEAQFGDFANGAQIVIDQFLSSAWQKWRRLCALTLLLPHGYEGAGPEHSSARLERFLQLCAQRNMQVCVPSTPAQIFHLLRRQMLRPARTPLIVMTPKSLLRHKLAVSSLDDLADGKFHRLIPEIDSLDPKKVTKVIICSGKVYYELLAKRRDEKIENMAILRIEELYPFPLEELTKQLEYYSHAKKVVWCQEEPKNQGAWFYIRHYLEECLQQGQTLSYTGRKASASPAAGYPDLYRKRQQVLVETALGLIEQ